MKGKPIASAFENRTKAVMNQTFRGVMKGQTLVLLEHAVPFPDGTLVEVRPLALEAGSPAAVLAAMEAEPHLTPTDVAELDSALAAGQRAAAPIDPSWLTIPR